MLILYVFSSNFVFCEKNDIFYRKKLLILGTLPFDIFPRGKNYMQGQHLIFITKKI